MREVLRKKTHLFPKNNGNKYLNIFVAVATFNRLIKFK